MSSMNFMSHHMFSTLVILLLPITLQNALLCTTYICLELNKSLASFMEVLCVKLETNQYFHSKAAF